MPLSCATPPIIRCHATGFRQDCPDGGAFNLVDGPLRNERDKEGWRFRTTRVGDEIGAERIGGSVYELADGERSFPYHYHHGVEEWLIVVDGSPTVRTPDGKRTLQLGDVVCFASGSSGAHDVVGPGPRPDPLGGVTPCDLRVPGLRQARHAARRGRRHG